MTNVWVMVVVHSTGSKYCCRGQRAEATMQVESTLLFFL